MADPRAAALAATLFGLVLAGCISSDSTGPSGLEAAFGKGSLSLKEGQPVLRGALIEGNIGTGWGPEPNTTWFGPNMTIMKDPDPWTPGGGTQEKLLLPEEPLPLLVRFVAHEQLAGFTARWGFFDPDGNETQWSEPMPANTTATLSHTALGTSRVVAEVTDPSGEVAQTEDAMKVILHAQWTINSEVWPLAPGFTLVCTPEDAPAGACVDQNGVFYCAPDPGPCDYQGLPSDVPDTPRPPNYDEMADEFTVNLPFDFAFANIVSEFRGTPTPDKGTDVDLELVVGSAFRDCQGAGGPQNPLRGGPPPPDASSSAERLRAFVPVGGLTTIRVGGVSCPWHTFYNHGPVPYTVTIDFHFGAPPMRGGGPMATSIPRPTQGATT